MMTDFSKEVMNKVGSEGIVSMVARDLKYKKDAKNRQVFIIVLLIAVIIIIFFNILILKQNFELNNLILQKLLDAFPKQPK